MNTVIAILVCSFLMIGYGFLVRSGYCLGMGDNQSVLRSKESKMICGLFCCIVAILCLYLIQKNQFVYYWDYGGYWTMSYSQMQSIFNDPISAMKHLYGSICKDDYNLLLPTLITIPLKVVGYTFTRYVMVNTIIFLIPVLMICISCGSKIFSQLYFSRFAKIGIMILIGILTVTFNVFYLAMLKGYIDIAALIPAGLTALLLFDYNIDCLNKKQIKRDILISLLLLSTFLFRRYFAYYIVGYVGALIIYALYKIVSSKHEHRVTLCKNICINILAMGGPACAVMVIFFAPLIIHILSNNYSEQYAAYDAPLIQKIENIVNIFGAWVFVLAFVAIFLSLITRSMRRVTFLNTCSFLITSTAFFTVQNMGIQHVYTIAIQLYLLSLLGIYQILYLLYKTSWKYIGAGLCIIVSIMGSLNCFFPQFRCFPTVCAKLFSTTYDPLYRSDIAQLQAMADYVNSLTNDTNKSVYILASGNILNSSIMYSLNLPYSSNALHNMCTTADVDLRDGFPSAFLTADIVVTTDPIELHLAEGTQEVVRYLAQEIVNSNSYIGQHYTKQNQTFSLDNGVIASVYIKTSDLTSADLQSLAQYYTDYYPDQEELFADRILNS